MIPITENNEVVLASALLSPVLTGMAASVELRWFQGLSYYFICHKLKMALQKMIFLDMCHLILLFKANVQPTLF